ncbi:MAG: hypothetical protein QF593_13375, partial [Nitrospinota bacterium]|nr:hypothetical protein [Nitrospinota bacterium]
TDDESRQKTPFIHPFLTFMVNQILESTVRLYFASIRDFREATHTRDIGWTRPSGRRREG